ncbi:MAG: hypothetical protein ABEK12_02430, partial [Candidatus Nanohaloarchaea archaeon]
MELRTSRAVVAATGILMLAGGIVFRAYRPVPGWIPAAAAGTGLTAVIVGAIYLGRRIDPHQRNLEQKKVYMTTFRSVVVTSALTGVLTLLLLFAASLVIGSIGIISGYQTLSMAVLADALQRLIAVLHLPPDRLVSMAAAAVLGTGTGFWLLYPELPIDNEKIGGPVTFGVAWIYVLAGTTLI